MGCAARDRLEHIANGRGGREESRVSRAESEVVAEREGSQAETEREAGGGVEKVRGRVGDVVEQVVGEGTEARGRTDAAGSAQQQERKRRRAAEKTAGDQEVSVELVDVRRPRAPRFHGRRRQVAPTPPFPL